MLKGINDQFAMGRALQFVEHPSGLIQGIVETELCSGLFFLHGAHVAQFRPAGAEPLLFLSSKTELRSDKPIRGGVPLCFPWFGPHPSDAASPAHGLVRTQAWRLLSAAMDAKGVLQIDMGLALEPPADAPSSFERWQLFYRVRWGAELDLNLTMSNESDVPQTCEVALHTYFALADVDRASVRGLERQCYLDKLTGATEPASGQAIRFTQETDRVYQGEVSEVIIDDPGYERQIRVVPRNSRSTVVWNPWIAKSQRMNDFGDDEYLRMCCIETANVLQDRLQVSPGGSASIGCTLS